MSSQFSAFNCFVVLQFWAPNEDCKSFFCTSLNITQCGCYCCQLVHPIHSICNTNQWPQADIFIEQRNSEFPCSSCAIFWQIFVPIAKYWCVCFVHNQNPYLMWDWVGNISLAHFQHLFCIGTFWCLEFLHFYEWHKLKYVWSSPNTLHFPTKCRWQLLLLLLLLKSLNVT